MTGMDRKIAQHLNFVHNDEIWKDHVRREFMSQRRKWPERWGYLVHEYQCLTHRLQGRPTTRYGVPDFRASDHDRLKLPPIHKVKTPVYGFPDTTTQQIGRIANMPDRQLEIYGQGGPKSRGQCGILKLLQWPEESAP